MPDSKPTAEAGRLRIVAERLKALADDVEREAGVREEVDGVVAELRAIQNRVYGRRRRARSGMGGKPVILAYLLERVGEVVYGDELAAITGIGEWPRRVRELRVQDGYPIEELGSSRYRLESTEPDFTKASGWALENAIRRRTGSGSSRIAAFFEANVGTVVTRKQIDYVSKIGSAARRVRELRDERGWPINSHIDDSALRPGEYRLTSLEPEDLLDPRQRSYGEDLRREVFERDDFTCLRCGRNRAAAEAAGDTRFYLEVHHRIAIADEDETLSEAELNDLDNLETLCHGCHREETAKLHRRRRRHRESKTGRSR
jgi:hypothetical protein